MLGDTSEFGPIDLLGSLAINLVTTNMAVKSDDAGLRYGIKVGQNKKVEAYTDVRFLGGVAAAVAAQFGGPAVRRYGHDIANGLLNSFVATETIQRHADSLAKARALPNSTATVRKTIELSGDEDELGLDYMGAETADVYGW